MAGLRFEFFTGMEALVLVGAYLFVCALELFLLRSVSVAPVLGVAGLIWASQRYHHEVERERTRRLYVTEGRAAVAHAMRAQQIKEPAVVVTKLFQSLWVHYIAAKATHRALPLLQATLIKKLPEKYDVKVTDFSLGTASPVFEDLSACCDFDGTMAALDARFYFESKGLSVTIAAKTPLGVAQIGVNKVIASGILRLVPVPEANLVAVSLVAPPRFEYGIEVVMGKQRGNLMQFAFLKRLVADALANVMTEPRRKILALDVAEVPQVKIHGGTVTVTVHSVSGSAVDGENNVALIAQVSKVMKSCASFRAGVGLEQEPFVSEFEIQGNSGQLVVRVKHKDGQGRSGKGGDDIIGQSVVDVQHLADGSTAIWCISEDGGVLAKRWRAAHGPWKISVPLELHSDPGPAAGGMAVKYATPLSEGAFGGGLDDATAPGPPKSESGRSEPDLKARALNMFKDRFATLRRDAAGDAPDSPSAHDDGSSPKSAAGAVGKSARSCPGMRAHPEDDSTQASDAEDDLDDEGDADEAAESASEAAGLSATAKRSASHHPYMLPSNPAFRSFVTLSISADEWRLTKRAAETSNRTPGPRAIALHLFFAEGVKAPPNAPLHAHAAYGRDVQVHTAKRFAPDPLWNACFALAEDTFAVNNEIHFTIAGGEQLSKSQAEYGKCKLSLLGLEEGVMHSQSLHFTGSDAGTLTVNVAVHPGAVDSAAMHASIAEFKALRALPADMIEVIIDQGRNLRPAGDPYIVATYGKQSHTTPVVFKSVEPVWHSAFHFKHEPSAVQTLSLRCKDKDVVFDAAMGELVIDLMQLGPSFQGWLPLKNVESGEILVRVFRGAANCAYTPPEPPAPSSSTWAKFSPPTARSLPITALPSARDDKLAEVPEEAASSPESEGARSAASDGRTWLKWPNDPSTGPGESIMSKLKHASPSILKSAHNFSTPSFLKKKKPESAHEAAPDSPGPQLLPSATAEPEDEVVPPADGPDASTHDVTFASST